MAENQYNPLDTFNLGKSVADALLDRPSIPLADIEQFDGAGIYAIYYKGHGEPYGIMAARNAKKAEWPIYVGKAIPSGGRKGATIFAKVSGRYLYNRLREHADSIRAVNNLELEDFDCRYLVVDDIWIPLAETLLISSFQPVWNVVLDGFGNHDPGAGRYQGLRPLWDVVHPGRPWASRCSDRIETARGLIGTIIDFLARTEPPLDPRLLFKPPSAEDVDL
ncbi:MAG: Eco29kI family restriction endonuclease [Roseiarcus sp.]